MTDYQTRQRRRNMIVGSFVVVALGAFLWMLFRFRDLPLAVSKIKSFEILVYFPEVPGVQKDTPVNYCGYQVGRVMKVAPPQLHGESHKVGVTLAIDKRYSDIPDDAQFTIMKRGLGSSYIEIRDISLEKPTDFLKGEMVLDGTVGMASDFFPPEVQESLPELVDVITDLVNNFNAVIGDKDNQDNIKETLDHINVVTAEVEKILTIHDLGNKIVLTVEELEATLSQTRQLLAKIDAGEGTTGKLVNDGRLYENLLESSRELKMLADQLKRWVDDAKENGLDINMSLF